MNVNNQKQTSRGGIHAPERHSLPDFFACHLGHENSLSRFGGLRTQIWHSPLVLLSVLTHESPCIVGKTLVVFRPLETRS